MRLERGSLEATKEVVRSAGWESFVETLLWDTRHPLRRLRMAPAFTIATVLTLAKGLGYVSSWVDDKLARCSQVMETDDRRLLDEWMANWSDLIDFEVQSVLTSKEAAEKIAQS